ncbi:hypothetical protein BD309DRAFT_949072, partial [Dichomitus squalens]
SKPPARGSGLAVYRVGPLQQPPDLPGTRTHVPCRAVIGRRPEADIRFGACQLSRLPPADLPTSRHRLRPHLHHFQSS